MLIIYAALSLIVLQSRINKQRDKNAELTASIAEQMLINAKYRTQIENDLDSSTLEAMIREKLGMIKRDEIVFVDISK